MKIIAAWQMNVIECMFNKTIVMVVGHWHTTTILIEFVIFIYNKTASLFAHREAVNMIF